MYQLQTIVISANNVFKFYSIQQNSSESRKGWELLENEVVIPSDFDTHENIGVYVYNPGDKAIYFDNLKISHYR